MDRAKENPDATVWFVRVIDRGAAVSEGTAVAVKLVGNGEAKLPRNYLLTCAHVVRRRGREANTFGPCCDEIRVWPPFSGFDPNGGLAVSPVPGVRPVDLGAERTFHAAEIEDIPNADWVLLEFADLSHANDQLMPTAQSWIDEDPLVGQKCTVHGYPGGAQGFQGYGRARDNNVRPAFSAATQAVASAKNGVIQFQGIHSRAGMSGGGVFCNRDGVCSIIGLHRERHDPTLQIHAVAITQIRRVLMSCGYEVMKPQKPVDGAQLPARPSYELRGGYTLLTNQAGLVGRSREISELDAWPKNLGLYADSRIVCLVALGGMGKSALTWHWYMDRADAMFPNGLAGKMWWSFYEPNATFSNFIAHALSYTEGIPLEKVLLLDEDKREDLLAEALTASNYLIVLDGLERVLIAYAGFDASYNQDATVTKYERQHLPRQTSDLRAGRFLRRLATLRSSRILISTRLLPAALEDPATVREIKGVRHQELLGLEDDDALSLWRAYGARGTKESLLRLFHCVGSHPLVLQTLAATIKDDPSSPGDFDSWQARHTDFTPYALDLTMARSHVILAVLHRLAESPLKLRALRAVAAFRGPAEFEHLAGMLIGPGEAKFPSEEELYATLTDLRDRGLIGRGIAGGKSRWDLHPLVRGVAWEDTRASDREVTLREMQAHFEAFPPPRSGTIRSLEDFAEARELFFVMTRLGLRSQAQILLKDRLFQPLYGLDDGPRVLVEMLEALYPDGEKLEESLVVDHNYAMSISMAFRACGRLGRAAEFFRLHADKCSWDHCVLNSARLLLDGGRIKECAEAIIRLLCKTSSLSPVLASTVMSMLASLSGWTWISYNSV